MKSKKRNEPLVAFRKYLGLNQKEMAKQLGLKQSGYALIELGKLGICEKTMLKLIRLGLNTSWYYLGEGKMIHTSTPVKPVLRQAIPLIRLSDYNS